MLASIFFLVLAARLVTSAEVQLGDTTLIGRDVPLLQQEFFGGIPFAEPPIGDLRLNAPMRKGSLGGGTFDASNFGLSCIQTERDIPAELTSEDCLTINVFRPSGLSATASLPVLFWTYGGGFIFGTSSAFNASALVAKSMLRGTPIIYVSFNYRLGPLGFPQGKEAGSRGQLNLGIKDQIAALEWVQENIHVFGGDKDKVTVFGQSAGAIMTAVLFLNPLKISRLARAAIFQSGSAGSSLTFRARNREDNWQDFITAIPGCDKVASTFECVRKANTTELRNAFIYAMSQSDEQYPFDPTLDDDLFPDYPSRLFKKGVFPRLPFIAGTNLDEGTFFVPSSSNYSEDSVRASLQANFSPPALPEVVVDGLLRLYPDMPALGSPYNTGNETFGLPSGYKRTASLSGDISFDSQRRLLSATAAKAEAKSFGYLFTQHLPTIPASYGVPHATELLLVYGGIPVTNVTAAAAALQQMMMDYWISFATSLDPNDGLGGQRPVWPQYTADSPVLLQLNGENTTVIADDYRKEGIAFINRNAAIFHH